MISLAVPAPSHQAETETKTCSALGQATRGNSELKEIEYFVESMKTVYMKKRYGGLSITAV